MFELRLRKRTDKGFTLAEIMVTAGVAGVLGVCVFEILRAGTILYAKNTAENLAHDQSRIAVNRIVHDIHEAVSIPQLGHIVPGNLAANPGAPLGSWTPNGTNVTFYAETTPPTTGSPGVSFQSMGAPGDPNGGPFDVSNVPGSADLIQIDSGSHIPAVGMRLIFPYYNMEDDIIKVTSNGSDHFNVWTKNGLETRFKKKKNTYHICYYTSRWAYVVEGSDLHLYSSAPAPTGVTWPITVARNIINPANRALAPVPFKQATSQYLTLNITTEDNHYSNRGFQAVNTLLAGSVPYRAQLCTSQ